jgi:predicted DNA-binding protein
MYLKIEMNEKDTNDDVRFTLPLSAELNRKIVSEAKRYGLTKTAYIRMILSQAIEKNEK